jgi:hypothetical protein
VRLTAPLVAALILLAGCGGSSVDAQPVLSQTAVKLGELRSGELSFKLLVDPRDGDEFGYEISGPFELAKEGLPKLDVEYTQIANGKRATVRLISTGEKAYVEVNGKAYELGPEQQEQLRSAGREVSGGLTSLDVSSWVVDPKGERDGDVDRVTGELDVVAVINGLGDVARGLGKPLPRLDADDAERLREAAKDTRFELESGHDDHLLRHLLFEADLGFDVPEDLRKALGDVVGAKITFQLDVDKPNEPVSVEASPNPRPSSELPGR